MNKKIYSTPASRTVVLAPATMLAASIEGNTITVTDDDSKVIESESDAWSQGRIWDNSSSSIWGNE